MIKGRIWARNPGIDQNILSEEMDRHSALLFKYPSDELYFIIGSDLLKYLDEWKDLSEINKILKFVAATRPGYPLENIPGYIQTMGIRAVDISGFEVRKCIKESKSFRYLVPEAVFDFINKKGLYK